MKAFPALAKLNFRIIEDRFPALWKLLEQAESPKVEPVELHGCVTTFRVHGAQFTSVTPMREAEAQCEAIPKDSPHACLYGAGLGYAPTELLARPALKKLAVFVLNAGIFKAMLERIDCREWLSDPRVFLAHASAMKSTIFGPLAVSPVEVRFPDDSAVSCRDRLRAYLNDKFNAFATRTRHDQDVARLKENAPFIDTDAPIIDFYRNCKTTPIIVCAAGPTLSQYYDWIKRQGAYVICVSGAMLPLQEAGITPDMAVVLDQDKTGLQYFKAFDSTETTLAYDPLVSGKILELWQGGRFWFTNTPEGLWSNGTVTHPAVDLAVKMGATEVFLLGCDFCYPRELSHVPGATLAYDVKRFQTIETINGLGERVKTANNLCQYRVGLEDLIARHSHVKFWKLGLEGVPVRGATWLEVPQPAMAQAAVGP